MTTLLRLPGAAEAFTEDDVLHTDKLDWFHVYSTESYPDTKPETFNEAGERHVSRRYSRQMARQFRPITSLAQLNALSWNQSFTMCRSILRAHSSWIGSGISIWSACKFRTI